MSTPLLQKHLQKIGSVPRPLTDYSTANLGDAMAKMAMNDRVLEPAIRPLLAYTKMVGLAVTMKLEWSEEGGSYVETYSRAFEAGSRVPSPILVIESPPDARFGTMGSGGAYIARNHYGFVGCILDGVVRDTDDLRNMRFQVYHRSISPGHIFGKMRGVSVNEPVVVGGVRIHPGDVIVGDNDGVLAIPQDQFERVIAAADEDLRMEEKILREIDEGKSYLDVIRRYQPEA